MSAVGPYHVVKLKTAAPTLAGVYSYDCDNVTIDYSGVAGFCLDLYSHYGGNHGAYYLGSKTSLNGLIPGDQYQFSAAEKPGNGNSLKLQIVTSAGTGTSAIDTNGTSWQLWTLNYTIPAGATYAYCVVYEANTATDMYGLVDNLALYDVTPASPSPSPTATPTPGASPSPTATPTATPTPGASSTPTPGPSPTDTPVPTPTPTVLIGGLSPDQAGSLLDGLNDVEDILIAGVLVILVAMRIMGALGKLR